MKRFKADEFVEIIVDELYGELKKENIVKFGIEFNKFLENEIGLSYFNNIVIEINNEKDIFNIIDQYVLATIDHDKDFFWSEWIKSLISLKFSL